MALPQLKLQPYQLSDLAMIRGLSSAEITNIASHLEKLSPLPLKPEILLKEFLKVLVGKEAVANAILRQSLSLCGVMRQMEIPIEDVLKGVHQGIVANGDWNEVEIEKWRTLEPSLQTLFSLPTVQRVAKTLDLSYEYANLLRRARIVTDIRPIFDKEAKQIEGAVISHTLRLRFDSVDGDHGLSIAMDENDIKSLLEKCQRALAKSQTARELMANRAGVATIVSGEDTDEAK